LSQAATNVSLLRLRTTAVAPVLTLYRRADGALLAYDEVTGGSTVGGQAAVGGWHELQVHAVVDGAAGQLQVWLDGAPVASLSKATDLGTAAVGRVYLGEPASGRTFDVAFDEVVVSTAPDRTAPSVPSGVSATTTLGNQVEVAWDASTDDVGVAGYDVHRDGALIATVEPGRTSWTDTSVVAGQSYTYAVDAFDGAGNHSALSPAVAVAVASTGPDSTAPSVPSGLETRPLSPTRVDLAWRPSTDDVGVAGYSVVRNGTLLATVDGTRTTFSDTTALPATSYSYAVDAYDLAGNHSARSGVRAATTPGPGFSDGFENGDARAWTFASGVAVQQAVVHGGTWAARATSTTAPAYVYESLSPALGDLTYDGWLRVQSQPSTSTVGLVRLRTATLGAVLSVMRRGDGRLALFNEVTHSVTDLPVLGAGAWHRLRVHAVVRGTASSVLLSLDGTTLLSRTDDLGINPVGRVYVGDTGANGLDLVVDDQALVPAPDRTPPTAPTGVTVNARGPRHVNITWGSSTDDVAVAGYEVRRDGALVGSVGPMVNGFADFSAAPDTTYDWTVTAHDSSGNTSTPSTRASLTTPADTAPSDPVVVAVGDTACGPADPSFLGGAGTSTACHQRYTSDLAWTSNPAAVLPLGDEQYEVGALSAFEASYDPSWGRMPTIAHPVPGNPERLTAGASGYWSYFGTAAGPAPQGWYSYDVGSWHVVALDGQCSAVGGCGAGSPQEQWLQADLAAHPARCTLAYWHEPRWSSGSEHGSDATYAQLWRDLYAAHADVVLNGHDHDYERFARQDASGQADPVHGIREIVVGTGGAEQQPAGALVANSEVFHTGTFGVLRLTLHPGSYDWRFVPDSSGTFTDSGSEACR
ncbi:MAG: hypothetical protein ACXVFV_04810, partial [Mycobacteriales bacterium]